MTSDCGLADPRLTVGADFAEENLQATHIELTHVQAASLRIWSCRGVGVSERGGSFRLGACACGSFLSCRTLAHGKKVFVTKAKLLGTGVLPLQELKVPACNQESGHLHKQTLDLSWMPALGSRVLELVVCKHCWYRQVSACQYVNHTTSEPVESTCRLSPLLKYRKPEAQRQKVPCIVETLRARQPLVHAPFFHKKMAWAGSSTAMMEP